MADAPLKIFICYAREDHEPLDMLRKKLAPLVHSNRIQLWYDREITGGKEWDREIRINLKTADIVLLLVSDDFFESEYIKSVELREALDGHAREENVVVPVILYDCLWYVHPELARLNALPEEAKPVFLEEHWKKPDLGFANIARGILKILDDPDTETRRHRKIERLRQAAEAAEKQRLQAEAEQKKREAAERQQREAAARIAEQKRREEDAAQEKRLRLEMVPVKGGPFLLGGEHSVTVPDFAIGKYPVTQKLWQEIMGNNPSRFKGDDSPVEQVSWDDVQEFLKKLNARFHNKQYRLPGEAEWEYAARGGDRSKGYEYAGSNNLDEVGWHSNNAEGKTHPVGQKKPNEFGLYDMSGNVWEWCEDDWHDNLTEAQKDGRAWVDRPNRGTGRVNRGGSWYSFPRFCRVACRNSGDPGNGHSRGFRLALSLQ